MFGIESGDKLASSGVRSSFIKQGENTETTMRTYGPDIAILECDEPHHLPALEIADPIQEDRTLVHMIGLSGLRYGNDDPSDRIGGVVCTLENDPTFVYIPRIIGQRFRCVPAFENGLKEWINRPFLKVVNERYLMEDQVYPNSPEGFGLIAQGDSGAGAIVIQNGKPLLVGVISCGQIEPIFRAIHDILSKKNFDTVEIQPDTHESVFLEVYNGSISTQSRNLKWFITQCLADVTHVKSWINSIVLKK
jgi:hypothetical protein